MNNEPCAPPLFRGTVEKIVIESEDSRFCPPEPGQEIMQRITVHRNGSVALTRYFSGDFSEVPPTPDTKTMKRYRGKPTEKLMEYLAFHFSSPQMPELICDAGVWAIELTNTDGERFAYVDSLGNDPVINGLKISQVGRRVLEIEELWLFDGGIPTE